MNNIAIRVFHYAVRDVFQLHGKPVSYVGRPVRLRDGEKLSAVWFVGRFNNGFSFLDTGHYLEITAWSHGNSVGSVAIRLHRVDEKTAYEIITNALKMIGLLDEDESGSQREVANGSQVRSVPARSPQT